jgi:hypothetical protein
VPVWALSNALKGITLNSSPIETNITFKSQTAIPYHIVSQSSDKIVVDFSSVDPTQTIPTDFAAADNIEQVILKPLGSDKLRMVIRGQQLGAPIVTAAIPRFAPAVATPIAVSKSVVSVSKPNRLVLEQSTVEAPKKPSQVVAPGEGGYVMTAFAATPEQTAAPSSQTVPAESEETQISDPSLPLVNNEEADLDASALGTGPTEAFAPDRKAIVSPDKGQGQQESNGQSANVWQDDLLSGLSGLPGLIKALGEGGGLRLFLFCGLIGFMFLFIRGKIRASQRDLFALDDEGENQPGILDQIFGGFSSGKPARQRSNRRGSSALSSSRTASLPADRPVGLKGLSAGAPPVVNNSLVNRNQALNQYAQNAVPSLQRPMHRDRTEIDRELQRSIHMRQAVSKTQTRKPYQAPVSRPAAPSKSQQSISAPAAQRPPQQPISQKRPVPNAKSVMSRQETGLPANNTEVLDFLRNVAELMEKDGKADLAQGVKSGIQQSRQF